MHRWHYCPTYNDKKKNRSMSHTSELMMEPVHQAPLWTIRDPIGHVHSITRRVNERQGSYFWLCFDYFLRSTGPNGWLASCTREEGIWIITFVTVFRVCHAVLAVLVLATDSATQSARKHCRLREMFFNFGSGLLPWILCRGKRVNWEVLGNWRNPCELMKHKVLKS